MLQALDLKMKYLLLILLVSGCTVTKTPMPVVGQWEFDSRLTYQSLYDKNGGLKPVESIDGDLYLGARYEYHFNRKYFDFDMLELVLIGYLDNGENETKKVVPLKVLKQTFNYVLVSYTTYWGEPKTEKIHKTQGCYYVENEDGFREYYCASSE